MKNTIHDGTVRLLKTIKQSNGHFFPFEFNAVSPATRSWAFRLLSPRDAGHLCDQTLTEKLRASSSDAIGLWEDVPGSMIGWVTIHTRNADGSTSQSNEWFERGPEKEMEMNLQCPDAPAPPKPYPKPPAPDIDLSF